MGGGGVISLKNYNYILTSDGELYHYGVKGMKWGHRRAENKIAKYRKKAKQYDKYAKEYAREGSRRTGSDGARQTDKEMTWMKQLAADNAKKSQKYSVKADKLEKKLSDKNSKKQKSEYQKERDRQKKHLMTKRAVDVGSRVVNEYTKRHNVSINGIHVGVHDNVKTIVNTLLDYKYARDTLYK